MTSKLDSPRAILLGLIFVALAILAVGFFAPREQYVLIKWGDGPRFIRMNTVTGAGVVCFGDYQADALECD